MSKAIKFLVSGYEASGKSSLTSTIKEALVINCDKKEYSFNIPHSNLKEYKGMDNLIDFINSKVVSYKELKGNYPKVIVIDTVTQLYSAMTLYNSTKYTGFNIHTQNNKDTLDFNDYIENILLPNGVSVVIVAHTIVDPDTNRHIIPSQGNFFKAGSWLSIVNDSIFIDKSSNKIAIYTNSTKYPARTTLKDIKEKIILDDYDINKHLQQLLDKKEEALEYTL